MRYGVCLPTYRGLADSNNIRETARRAEDLGYDSLWVTDHVIMPEKNIGYFGDTIYDPLQVLTYAAALTKRVQLGTAIMVVPYRHVLLQAKMVATLDVLSGGRAVLGAGVGWIEEEFTALGVPFHQRGAITDEYLQAFRVLWSEEKPRFAGTHVRFSDIRFEPKPLQGANLPIYIGGTSRRAIRRAVELGQGWFPDSLPFKDLQQSIGYLRETAREHGRDPSSLEVLLRTGLQVTDRTDGAGVPEGSGVPAQAGWRTQEFTTTEEETARVPFVGTKQQIIDDIHTCQDLGVTQLIFEFPVTYGDERLDTLELFANDIRPHVR